jgi:hypothetical protein
VRIGYLSLESSPARYLEAFHDGLRRLGYVDGGSIVIESRLAEGRAEKLAALAGELVALNLNSVPEGDDLAEVFGAITRERVDAIVAIAGPMTLRNSKQIAEFAIKTRLPMIAGWLNTQTRAVLYRTGPIVVTLCATWRTSSTES